MPPKSKPKTHKASKPAILPTPLNPTPSEFSAAIARTAVAQICHSIGYRATQLSALEALTHVAISYLVNLGKSSVSYANKANRTDSNLFDFTNAINDMSLAKGFSGASEIHMRCVLGSSVLKELANFVEYVEETPFAWPIPRREKIGEIVLKNQESYSGRGGGVHVLRWLPRFPEVREAEVVKRREGEQLWEDLVVENRNGGGENGNENVGNGNKELGVKSKRGRVRFKMGGVEEKVGVTNPKVGRQGQ